ncbi:TetR/AcrR family transcriptional regulator [Streptomyces sp. V2]|uniref:TetR/AcrR family transcriptional regulator n=1 Tax=Streptomyces TaxID=1883 RepID=UPI0006EB8BEA|nr:MULTISPECIES: TetR/AcrR family transcriptional regulator [Streptomyces]PWG15469.1 TetR/AcrR family transcriptional regulator [Streptomyces sp. V2]
MGPTTGARRRGPYATTPARRKQIVRAALAGFAEHGYERASLRDIAARAGVTHAALLRHFSGKEELLLAALALREADEEEAAARIMASGTAGPAVLGAVLADEFANPDYQRNWLSLALAATNPDHPAHEYFLSRRERMRTRFRSSTLRTAHDSTDLTADEKVVMVLAMLDGLRVQALLDPSQDVLHLLEVFMRTVIGAEEGEEDLGDSM